MKTFLLKPFLSDFLNNHVYCHAFGTDPNHHTGVIPAASGILPRAQKDSGQAGMTKKEPLNFGINRLDMALLMP